MARFFLIESNTEIAAGTYRQALLLLYHCTVVVFRASARGARGRVEVSLPVTYRYDRI